MKKEQRWFGIVVGLMILAALVLGGVGLYASRRSSVIVEWSTASELDTVGFNLYRSETPEGPFEQVNGDLIPAADDPLVGGNYEYKDTKVLPGHTYYYWLEDVNTQGAANRNGPIEVTAEGGGQIEMAVAGVTFVLALVIGWQHWRQQRVENET
jgi:hypothetical protein